MKSAGASLPHIVSPSQPSPQACQPPIKALQQQHVAGRAAGCIERQAAAPAAASGASIYEWGVQCTPVAVEADLRPFCGPGPPAEHPLSFAPCRCWEAQTAGLGGLELGPWRWRRLAGLRATTPRPRQPLPPPTPPSGSTPGCRRPALCSWMAPATCSQASRSCWPPPWSEWWRRRRLRTPCTPARCSRRACMAAARQVCGAGRASNAGC